MIDCNRHYTVNGVIFVIARCFVFARSLICNWPVLKDISFNLKCLLVWCDKPVITCLVRVIFRINNPRDF